METKFVRDRTPTLTLPRYAQDSSAEQEALQKRLEWGHWGMREAVFAEIFRDSRR